MIKIPGTIPIIIHPFFWLLAAAIGWFSNYTIQGTLIWVAIILISVIVHEFGHALTAFTMGQKVHIELVGFGGVTQRQGGRQKLWKEILIVFNGPLAGFALSLTAWWLSHLTLRAQALPNLTYWLFVTAYVNLFWTVINLLPIQPLDGGKLLNLFLEALFGLKGLKISLIISLIFSGLLSLFFFYSQSFLAGSLFFLLAYESLRAWKESRLVSEQDQNLALQHLLKEAERELSSGRREEALEKFMSVRELTKSGLIYLTATEEVASLLYEKGESVAAYEMLTPLKAKLTPNGLRLLHQLAYLQCLWDEAALTGDKVYHQMPHYEVALMNAISHSVLGHTHQAIGWLKCTIRDGAPNVKEIISRKEFDPIRNDPQFKSLNTL